MGFYAICSVIDPHVHFRDGKEAYKETIRHGIHVASRAGIVAVGDMPNTKPPVLDLETALMRADLAHAANMELPEHQRVVYRIFMGLTNDRDQRLRAIDAVMEHPHIFAGIKRYDEDSTNNMGITEEAAQEQTMQDMADRGFNRRLSIHPGCEEINKRGLWTATDPYTHSLVLPIESAITSTQRNIERAKKYGIAIHIAHVSTPEEVELVNEAKEAGIDVTCGVTMHHLYLSNEYLKGPDGVFWKMNPPLRDKARMEKVRQQFIAGQIDCHESDHAYHTLDDKRKKHSSGVPGLPYTPHHVRNMLAQMEQSRVEDVFFNNANRIFFEDKVKQREVKPDFDLAGEYAYDPFADLKK